MNDGPTNAERLPSKGARGWEVRSGRQIVTLASVQQLMGIHVATIFGYDADGRIRFVREPWNGPPRAPPRFFMGRTNEGNVWRFRHDLPDELTRRLEELCRSEPLAQDLARPSLSATKIRTALQAHGRIPGEERGPACLIPERAQPPTDAVLITQRNGRVLDEGFPWMLRHVLADADIGPVTAVVVKGKAVSICYCARLSPAAAEAGVKTQEAMRGKGFATAAVAKWAAAVRDRGLLPMYSTTWDNLASRRVAEKLGAVHYGEDWLIH